MSFVPRTVDQILVSLKETFDDLDPTLDVTKGPISVLIYAVAQEIARMEFHASYLSTVYQLDSTDLIDDDDLAALASSFSIDPDVGGLANAVVTLYRFAKPQSGQLFSANEGDLVGTADGRFVFSLTKDVNMDGDTADIYYNPDTQRYEVSVPAEATAIGDDFNIPADTITALLSPIPDFDGVTNVTEARGGADQLDNDRFKYLLWNQLQGLDRSVAGSLVQDVQFTDPIGFTDIRIIPSTNFDIFERTSHLNGKLGYDIYTITSNVIEYVQRYSALGRETSITLTRPPVQAVQYVTVDGVRAGFSFVPDTSQAYRNSPMASDVVHLVEELQPGQTVEIKYFYYDNIYQAWRGVRGRDKPFGGDVLVRLAYPIPVYVQAEIEPLTSGSAEDLKFEVANFTENYFKDPLSPSATERKFVDELDPNDYVDAVLREVPSISNFRLRSFNRIDQAVMDIELISFDGWTQYPFLSGVSDFII